MKNVFKIMFIISLSVILLLLCVLVVFAVTNLNNCSESVGIIGGADGPTAILITSTLIFDNPVFWLLAFVSVLFVVSAIGWFITGKK